MSAGIGEFTPARDDDDLSRRGDDLQRRHLVDRLLIAQLEAEGMVDRAKIANLEVALVTARRIGAAVGILMAMHKLTDVDAFARLREVSQQTGRKLKDIAEDVLLTGALPAEYDQVD